MSKEMKFSFTIDPNISLNYSETLLEITAYLNDPDGWGILFLPTSTNPDFRIRMCSDLNITKICGLPSGLSCAEMGGTHMYLNVDRWLHGASKSGLDLPNYRQYMVSHEVGHILGHGHTKCPGRGNPAPIMMQQTLGIGSCKPNTKIHK